MKKISLILITVFAIIGAVAIYKFTNKEESINSNNTLSSNDYSMLNDDNVFTIKSIDNVVNIINKETGIIFFCIPENEWCNYYISYLNEIAKESNIKEINYLNIKRDRQYNTNGYRKLINALNDYLYKDDEGNKKIFVPTLVFIKDGKIVSYDNEVLLTNVSPSEYWTEEKIDELKNRINNYIIKYREEL